MIEGMTLVFIILIGGVVILHMIDKDIIPVGPKWRSFLFGDAVITKIEVLDSPGWTNYWKRHLHTKTIVKHNRRRVND